MTRAIPSRLPRWGWHACGLGVTVAAVISIMALPPDPPPPVTVTPITTPQRPPTTLPGLLPDGTPYTPRYLLPNGTSLGEALSPDGSALRLVERAATGAVRVLRHRPTAHTPQYVGFTRVGSEIVWAESHAGPEGGRTELWAVAPDTTTPPRRVTADTGDVVFVNSQYDIVAHGDRLYWLAVAGRAGHTELRSVAVSGGAVTTHVVPGEWTLSAWPWLVSIGAAGPIRLRAVDTGREVTVQAGPEELAACSPTWCRVLVSAPDGTTHLDVMRVDGSQRRRIGGDSAVAAVVDVALLDRFEVLTVDPSSTVAIDRPQLVVYDLATDRTITIAERAHTVLTRAGLLWWSTGLSRESTWQVVDLRALR